MGRLSSSTPDQEDDSKGSKGTEPAEGAEEKKRPGVVLEPNVVLEPAATVEGTRVGEGTTLEAASKVSAGAVVGKVCSLTSSHLTIQAINSPSSLYSYRAHKLCTYKL